MLPLSDKNLVTEAFKSTSNIDDLLIMIILILNIYPTVIQLHKAFYTVVPFLNLYIFIINGIVLSKLYDKRDDFIFETFIFHISRWKYSLLYFFWCILQLIRFAGVYFRNEVI